MYSVEIDTRELEAQLSKIDKFAQNEAIPLAAVTIKAEIESLTSGGLDIYAKSMRQYTDKYAKKKAKLLGSATPVNMRLENKMIKSPSLRGDTLAFWDDHENDKARGNLRLRKFFGASKLIADLVGEAINKRISRML